ncbi:MAG: hypothetical protein R3212_04700 [Xanthomonadales bacterium]|nr:hypothetical protein [Xanthomonadales bacterium]
MMPVGGVEGHGGVVMEEDQCVIDIGLFRAHFTIYQPQTRASEEFCEDVPDLGETLFTMDYLHDSLRRMPVDFRIVRDVNDRRTYAAWEDVSAIEDLDAATVYYQPARIESGGALTTRYEFTEKGWYIGVVTTRHPDLDKTYRAVFGFHVGGQGLGYWPWLLLLAVLVQLHFWVSNGGFNRWRAARRRARHDEQQSVSSP